MLTAKQKRIVIDYYIRGNGLSGKAVCEDCGASPSISRSNRSASFRSVVLIDIAPTTRYAGDTMSQKQRDKQQRREARKQKGHRPGLSPAQRQAAYEERCAKRKAHELKLKELAEAERTRQRTAAHARESALADALASASVPAEGGELRLLGLHDVHRYNYPAVVQINGIDFIVADVRNSDGDTWLSLKPKPQPQPMPPLDRVPMQRFRSRLGPSGHLALAAALMLGGLDRK